MTTVQWSNDRDRQCAIELRLDSQSGVPTYLQLVQQVEHAVRLGYLRPGDQLPTVKEAVRSLAINPNTVMKAYRELEHRGLAAGRPGQGTFISSSLPQVGLPQQADLRRRLLAWLRAAAGAGLDRHGIEAMVDLTVREFFSEDPAAVGENGLAAGQGGMA